MYAWRKQLSYCILQTRINFFNFALITNASSVGWMKLIVCCRFVPMRIGTIAFSYPSSMYWAGIVSFSLFFYLCRRDYQERDWVNATNASRLDIAKLLWFCFVIFTAIHLPIAIGNGINCKLRIMICDMVRDICRAPTSVMAAFQFGTRIVNNILGSMAHASHHDEQYPSQFVGKRMHHVQHLSLCLSVSLALANRLIIYYFFFVIFILTRKQYSPNRRRVVPCRASLTIIRIEYSADAYIL